MLGTPAYLKDWTVCVYTCAFRKCFQHHRKIPYVAAKSKLEDIICRTAFAALALKKQVIYMCQTLMPKAMRLTIILLDKFDHQVFGEWKVCEVWRHVCTAAHD